MFNTKNLVRTIIIKTPKGIGKEKRPHIPIVMVIRVKHVAHTVTNVM